MIVAELMSRFPVIVSPALSCGEALSIADERAAHFLLAVAGDELLGVVRSCDLRKSSPSARVARAIRAPIMPIARTDLVHLAKRLLTLGGAGCLVVVDDASCLQGTLTRDDLARAGLLSGGRGVDSCAACGAAGHLLFTSADQPAFCCECLERARPCEGAEGAEARELTLGGSA